LEGVAVTTTGDAIEINVAGMSNGGIVTDLLDLISVEDAIGGGTGSDEISGGDVATETQTCVMASSMHWASRQMTLFCNL
tara:strand:- start:1239 stop:1478 length:240 start_codon:yes stop_codon:yes gene_type:complete